MAPRDFTDGLAASIAHHHDDQTSCSSCDSDIIIMKQKRAVHFNEQCYLKLYAMPNETDRVNAWYTCDDLQQFKQNCKAVAKAALKGRTIEGEEMVFGLESHFRERFDLKKQRRYLCWELVLDGQNDNRTPIDIAAKCSKVSEGSSNDAERTATLLRMSILHDAKVAPPSKKVLTRRHSPILTEPRLRRTVSRVA